MYGFIHGVFTGVPSEFRPPANTRQPVQNEICEFIERSLSFYFFPNPPVSSDSGNAPPPFPPFFVIIVSEF
jgi:hypothetical protein